MNESRIDRFKSIWVAVYALGIILPPPIHFKDRLLFLSDFLFIPFIVLLGQQICRGEVKPLPRKLLWVWGASIVAFCAGIFRGDLAVQISIYKLGRYEYFSVFDDGIVFARMIILFSTPWIVGSVLKGENKYYRIFVRALKWAVLISGILAILDYQPIHIINLERLGYYDSALGWWSFRAHGTFLTPIEASFVYGAMAVFLLASSTLAELRDPLNMATLVISLVAVVLTHGGTALLGLVVTIGAFLLFERSEKRWLMAGALGFATLLAFIALPKVFFLQKIGDFFYRQKTYKHFFEVLPSHPGVLLYGIGFSRVCADNNFILLVIQGGLLLFTALFRWFWSLARRVPKPVRYLLIFWSVTWLSFDSLTYWGIGRLAWFLLGF